MKALNLLSVSVMVLLFCCTMPCYAHTGGTAYATPLSDITIDGNLDDWPDGLHVYQIGWIVDDFVNPSLIKDPEDFSASFRVGYNLKDNLLYVAVVVIDDDLLVNAENPNIQNQDVCGVYVDADHSGGDSDSQGRQLYVMVPGPSTWRKSMEANPSLNKGDTKATGMKGAFSYSGNTIFYEWEIPLFDTFPAQRHQIQVGTTIGFEFVMGDADDEEKATYIHWTPGSGKKKSSDLFGHLVFLNGYEDLGTISGVVFSENEKSSLAGITIEAYRDEHLITTFKTDPSGRYEVKFHQGDYVLKTRRGQGISSAEQLPISVRMGQEIQADLNVTTAELPEIFVKSMVLYKSLRGYKDTTTIYERNVKPGMDNRQTSPMLFAFEKPNRIRIENILESTMGLEFFSSGEKMVTYMENWKQYTEEDAPDRLTSVNLRMIRSFVVKNIIMSDDPFNDLKIDIIEAKEVGSESLNGISTTIVEVTQSVSSLGASMAPGNAGEDMMIPVKMWIGNSDYLIRKVAYELDMEQIAKLLSEQQRARMGSYFNGLTNSITETHTEIEIDPVFSGNDFTFIPPEGAELVDKFSPPGSPGSKDSKIDKPAPDFTLNDIDGNESKLADFKGKVVLMDFWATWCGPCVQAMPHVQAIYEIYKEKDVIVLGINSWERDKDKVKPFLEENNITYKILLDENNEVVGEYGVIGIPTFFVIDKKGLIRYSYTGLPSDTQIIQKNVEELLLE